MKTKVVVVKTMEDFEKIRVIRGEARIIVILANSIDCKGNEFLPLIKPDASIIMYGNGNTISNVVINEMGHEKVGIFGEVRNLYVRGVNLMNITVSGNKEVGALAGDVIEKTDLKNVNVKSKVSGYQFIGGVVGTTDEFRIADSSIESEVSSMDIEGNIVSFCSTYHEIGNVEVKDSKKIDERCGFSLKRIKDN